MELFKPEDEKREFTPEELEVINFTIWGKGQFYADTHGFSYRTILSIAHGKKKIEKKHIPMLNHIVNVYNKMMQIN